MSETLSLRQPTPLRVPERRGHIGASRFLVDPESGERIEIVETTFRNDADFAKIWVANILAVVDEISNAKMRVLWYILKNVDKMTNVLLQTIDEIAAGSATSKSSVVRTLNVLDAHDVVRRRWGYVQLNPNVMMTGTSGKRRALLVRFEQMELPLAEDE